jgi:membrane protein
MTLQQARNQLSSTRRSIQGQVDETVATAREGSRTQQLVAIVVTTARQTFRDDVPEMSAALAYRFFLSIFPFALFIAALASAAAIGFGIENPARQGIDAAGTTLPPDVSPVIRDELQRMLEQSRGIASFTIVATVFFATGGTLAVIRAMNRAFDVVESRPIWRRYLVAIGLTLFAGAGIVGAFLTFAIGGIFGESIAEQLGIEDVYRTIFEVGRFALAFLLVFVAIVLLYRIAPNLRLPWRYAAAGAAVFALGWLATTAGFIFYISNFADYGATFGALAGVAILLIWFYLTGFLLLVAAEACAVLQAMYDPDLLDDDRALALDEAGRSADRRSGRRSETTPDASGADGGDVSRDGGRAGRRPRRPR